jgi:YD repeat-containing protein
MIHRSIRIIFPALLYCMQLSAQYASGISELHYTNSAGETGITTYIYNGRDTPYKAIWELSDGSRWSVNYHEFDTLGNLVRKYREYSDSITSTQTYTYNENGQLIRETFNRSDGVTGNVEYIYANGRCRKADCMGLNGWYSGDIEYRYGDSDMKDSAILVREGNRIGIIRYEYDSENRLLTEVWSFSTGFTQTFRYNYREPGCRAYRSSNVFIRPDCRWNVSKEEYDFNGQGGGPSYYEYADDNRLLKKIFVRSDGLKTITEFTYLDNGLLKESFRQYNDGKTGTFTYTYDDYDQLVKRVFLRSDGVNGLEQYMYDDHGRLASGKYLNFDGWLTGDLVFEHDRYDRISDAGFSGHNGLQAEIRFKYDQQGHLVSIHWNFPDGTTQTYGFEYSETD